MNLNTSVLATNTKSETPVEALERNVINMMDKTYWQKKVAQVSWCTSCNSCDNILFYIYIIALALFTSQKKKIDNFQDSLEISKGSTQNRKGYNIITTKSLCYASVCICLELADSPKIINTKWPTQLYQGEDWLEF